MKTQLHVALVDDWELRGDGSGDMRQIQFANLRKILEIYESYGLKASINAEVMQQLRHLEYASQSPELNQLSQEWEDVVKAAHRNGHDVQLHVHSQWSKAQFNDGRWQLKGDWSILNYEDSQIRGMVMECKNYLESLLKTVNPNYRVVSFRSGAWCIAPHPSVLKILSEAGVVFDMSIVGGLSYNNQQISLDYMNCQEDFEPFFPDMKDARKVSSREEPIVCIPTLSYCETPLRNLKRYFVRGTIRFWPAAKRIFPYISEKPTDGIVSGSALKSGPYQVWDQPSLSARLRDLVASKQTVADISQLSFDQTRFMIEDALRRAQARGVEQIPIVLENHTKDIWKFRPIERLAKYLAAHPQIQVLTLTEIADNLSANKYRIVKSNGYKRPCSSQNLNQALPEPTFPTEAPQL